MVGTIKSVMTTSWVTTNGNSECVGAIIFKAGTFSNACTIPTKTFRYNATAAPTT